MKPIKQFPHCDPRVLHAPGECKFCDMHADWQALREMWGINFTGHYECTKSPCPAEKARSLDTINRWGGNRPENAESKRIRKELFREIEQIADRIMAERSLDSCEGV